MQLLPNGKIKMNRYTYILTCFLIIIFSNTIYSQNIVIEEIEKNIKDSSRMSEDEILNILDNQPNFGIYKDNYFITGINTNKALSIYDADAKYQISIRHRLTKTILPFNTFLMLTYTQKSFWNIYEKSLPFKDNNYNPGLTLAKPVILDNKLLGLVSIALEHESNGRDSIYSRSWNNVVLSGVYLVNSNLSVQGKLWMGLKSIENPDLYKYKGYGLVALNYRTNNEKFWFSAILNPRHKFGDFNTQLEMNIKLISKSNQYIFIQWYNGYGESLLDYNQYSSMVRMGICIKPPFQNVY